MKLRRYTFRILFPLIYLALVFLAVARALVTPIAEGPSRFEFLTYPAIYPGAWLVGSLDRLPMKNVLVGLLLMVLLNFAFYFGLGYLLDYLISRFGKRSS